MGMPVDSSDVEHLLSIYETELEDPTKHMNRKSKKEAVVEIRKRFRKLVDETIRKDFAQHFTKEK